ncbi:DUF2158 domain-containing protein [Aquabacter sp. L1I39]|uniref:DUF2158 domain-containing protein n=1 Tax=Aquabacter sp. L1I39 TaxID=2820278 RepID=UPI001ADB5C8F|nr:DUF2158 domain-containing protein [Aquabacter sp. L1I39]QTL03376.1 DUF2158 domain-containing protein [Aquabacter sp. L1I39]
MAIAPGEIVQLKSGSPALTVVAVEGEKVEVVWFSEEAGEFRSQSLPLVALDELEVEEFELDEDDEDEDEEEEADKD